MKTWGVLKIHSGKKVNNMMSLSLIPATMQNSFGKYSCSSIMQKEACAVMWTGRILLWSTKPVVTTESLKSVWCSWEIGFADCAKGPNDIAILAIKPNNGRWKNHEYLQQYPWISYDQARHLFMVTTPEGKRLTLFNWLS